MNEHLRRYSERALCVKWNINQSSEKVDIQYVLSFFVIMNMISQGIQNLHIYCPNIYCCNSKYLAISALISFTWMYCSRHNNFKIRLLILQTYNNHFSSSCTYIKQRKPKMALYRFLNKIVRPLITFKETKNRSILKKQKLAVHLPYRCT